MKIQGEKGQALPLVMVAVMIGALVIPPFLEHTGSSLIGSHVYGQSIEAQYSADAGAEYAIWLLTDGGGSGSMLAAGAEQAMGSLAEGGITANLSTPGSSVSYTLPEAVNGLTTDVKISNCWETIASDDFESGGWTGGSGWLDSWTHTGDSSITGENNPYEGIYHLMLQNDTGSVSRSVDLSKQVSARLRFRARARSFETGETATCDVSSNGVDWTTAYTWTDADSDNSYHYYDIDLTPYSFTSQFKIAFNAHMSGNGDYFYVDNLDIAWVVGSFKKVAADDFESGGWDGGSGWSDNWTHGGTSSVTSSGSPYDGSYHLLLQNSDGNTRRPLDLSEQGIVHLRFWAKVESFEGSENARARISSNGSDWTTVYEWVRGDDDGQYHFYDIDLTPYTFTDHFWIRFVANMSQNSDYFYVDDIDIESMHGYAITVTSGDRVIKAAVNTDDGVVTVLSWNII
jgi:hypothetical protein